jgi:hypothetical protein
MQHDEWRMTAYDRRDGHLTWTVTRPALIGVVAPDRESIVSRRATDGIRLDGTVDLEREGGLWRH